MPKNPPPEHCPAVRILTERGKADLYVDGILTGHRISEEAKNLAWEILRQVIPEGTEVSIGINGFAAFGITLQQAEALAPRLTQVWRADSGLGPAPALLTP
ncbi:hypothetical protein ACIHFD_49665 [Nonomuraea sp. NPDC051941]|uniref:hypothetical protein n=1 Tax=Nonomuraea sp. NPDC051941 TaxID=3364373 RepID=UPI0037C54105